MAGSDHHRNFLRGGALTGSKTTAKKKIFRNKALTGYWIRELSPRSGSIPTARKAMYPNISRIRAELQLWSNLWEGVRLVCRTISEWLHGLSLAPVCYSRMMVRIRPSGTWNSQCTISEADVLWNPTPRTWFVWALIRSHNPKSTNCWAN